MSPGLKGAARKKAQKTQKGAERKKVPAKRCRGRYNQGAEADRFRSVIGPGTFTGTYTAP